MKEGEVFIDGIRVSDLKLRNLRNQIAIVEQEPFLFSDTIYNNIRLGNRQSSKEQIIEAAEKAHIHNFIESLPEGYETVVGELGGLIK